jgi:hypothetical protein
LTVFVVVEPRVKKQFVVITCIFQIESKDNIAKFSFDDLMPGRYQGKYWNKNN